MKKRLHIGLFVIVMGLFYGCVKDLHNEGISEATLLKGRVLEESEREPLVNVIVKVTNDSTDYVSSKTNNEGRFELTVNFNNCDAGSYLFLDAGSSGITKKIKLKGFGQESYDYGEIFLYNKNDGAAPTISTSAVKDISSNGAVCGGNITSDGGSEVARRGLCWSTSENPNVSNSNVLCGLGTGEFTGAMTGLTPNTKYYVRAFATNMIGTSYGEQREFTTANGGGNATKPKVTTNPISNITSNSAKCGGNVTSDGGATVTERGVCWAKASTTHSPTISNHYKKDTGAGTGSFSCSMTDLASNTEYYVCAYANNTVGISYGDPVKFTTLSGGSGHTVPAVETGAVGNINSSSATCGGNVTSDGGATVTERGVCYSTSQNPTTSNHTVTSGTGTGSYTCNLTGLSANTKYYVRAYAINSEGEAYGQQKDFMTLSGGGSTPTSPTVTTVAPSNISTNSATCGGNVTSDGGATVMEWGVCYSTSQNPTTSNHTVPGGGTGTGSYTCSLTGLSANTKYYVRAYAINSAGKTGYGTQKDFTTLSGGGSIGNEFSENFDSGVPSGWTMIDADGDGYTWVSSMTPGAYHNSGVNLTGTGHNGSAAYVISGSWINQPGQALTPDNYLVSPRVTLKAGSTFSFYACAQDANYPADHFGVAVSDNGTGQWTIVNEWTMTAKNGSGITSYGRNGNNRDQGNWYLFSVDLSAFTGQKYIAIRHFNCTDQFILNIDDVQLSIGGGGSATTPTVTTSMPSNITTNSATCGGNVTSDGGATVKQRGVCYGTSHNPTTSSSVVPSGSGTGSFTCNLTGLNPNTTYYIKAYATNSEGTTYGDEENFETDSEPVVNGVLQYDDGNGIDAIGLEDGGTIYWANMFPSSMLGQYAGTSIVKIGALLNFTGNYTIMIYSGGSASPGSIVASYNVNHSSSEYGWYYTTLPTAVSLDTSKNLWIVLSKTHSAGEYPAGVCADSGNPNGRWLSEDGETWEDLAAQSLLFTWGIHTYVTNSVKGGEPVLINKFVTDTYLKKKETPGISIHGISIKK